MTLEEMEELVLKNFGTEELLDMLLDSLSPDEKEDIYMSIIIAYNLSDDTEFKED